MALIDPTKTANTGGGGGGGSRRECGPGRKTLIPIGQRYRQINGNPVVDVRSVCITDHADNGDEGAVVTDTFWLTDRAMWRVAQFALAVGWSAPFDPEDSEDMDKVILSGPFVADLSTRRRNGKDYIDVKNYEKAKVQRDDRTGEVVLTDEQRKSVEGAEKGWQALLRKVASNSSGQGYGSRPQANPSTAGHGRGMYESDDIPF